MISRNHYQHLTTCLSLSLFFTVRTAFKGPSACDRAAFLKNFGTRVLWVFSCWALSHACTHICPDTPMCAQGFQYKHVCCKPKPFYRTRFAFISCRACSVTQRIWEGINCVVGCWCGRLHLAWSEWKAQLCDECVIQSQPSGRAYCPRCWPSLICLTMVTWLLPFSLFFFCVMCIDIQY